MRGFSRRSCLVAVSSVVAARSLYAPMSLARQTGDSSPVAGEDQDETIWFVIAPAGKSNGDYFDVEIAPGGSATLSGVFGNGSEVPVEARMYAANVTQPVNGGFALEDSTVPIESPTTWLEFPTELISFEPRALQERSFMVTVPDGTAPGQYITGVAIETAEGMKPPGDLTILIKYRLIAAVLITVPGPVEPAFEISDLTIAVDELSTIVGGTITNTGNIRVRPEGPIKLTGADGGEVLVAELVMQSVYAGHSARFEVASQTIAPIESLTYTITLNDPDTGSTAEFEALVEVEDLTAEESPVTISTIEITPMPSAENLVFAQMKVTISNIGQPVAGIELGVLVSRDGDAVDEAILASSLSLAAGDTIVEQPYIPEAGSWEPGDYAFEFVLSAVDPQSGAKSELDRVSPPGTITVE